MKKSHESYEQAVTKTLDTVSRTANEHDRTTLDMLRDLEALLYKRLDAGDDTLEA